MVDPPSPEVTAFTQWVHRLRNEVNTATMAAAAARSLLDAGQVDQARVNLDRVEGACRRSAALLSAQPGCDRSSVSGVPGERPSGAHPGNQPTQR
ncbi:MULTISPECIES: hypothetical protein [Novilysobacter]|uniref:hypothetical protein n=1 Tax=Novilysobacter TaxID=3382699 RepID=UPI002FC9E54C